MQSKKIMQKFKLHQLEELVYHMLPPMRTPEPSVEPSHNGLTGSKFRWRAYLF